VKTLFAGGVYYSDGPFDRPQRYIRTNFFAKATASLAENVEASAWLSYLNSNWFASGQIPTRAVRSGLIDRFGAIDNSEGGNTQRLSGNADLRWSLSDRETVRVHAYGQYYQLDLFSNFTFFLNDPVDGDEIEQSDRNRKVFGLDTSYERRDTPLGIPLKAAAGFQFRSDRAGRARQRQGPESPRQDPGRPHLRDVVLAVCQVRRRAVAVAPDGDRRPQRHLQLQCEQQPVRGARSARRQYDAGDPERQVQRDPRPVLADRVLRQLRDRLPQQRRARRRPGSEPPALAQATGCEFGVRTKIVPQVEASFTYW
jgi:hypothetical protein